VIQFRRHPGGRTVRREFGKFLKAEFGPLGKVECGGERHSRTRKLDAQRLGRYSGRSFG